MTTDGSNMGRQLPWRRVWSHTPSSQLAPKGARISARLMPAVTARGRWRPMSLLNRDDSLVSNTHLNESEPFARQA